MAAFHLAGTNALTSLAINQNEKVKQNACNDIYLDFDLAPHQRAGF
jgi:hypothetical protein